MAAFSFCMLNAGMCNMHLFHSIDCPAPDIASDFKTEYNYCGVHWRIISDINLYSTLWGSRKLCFHTTTILR